VSKFESLVLTYLDALAMVFTVYAFNGVSLFFVIRGRKFDFVYDIALVDVIWVMRNAVRDSSSSTQIKKSSLGYQCAGCCIALCLINSTECCFLMLAFEKIHIMKYLTTWTTSNGCNNMSRFKRFWKQFVLYWRPVAVHLVKLLCLGFFFC